jgi:hypothetical protein
LSDIYGATHLQTFLCFLSLLPQEAFSAARESERKSKPKKKYFVSNGKTYLPL